MAAVWDIDEISDSADWLRTRTWDIWLGGKLVSTKEELEQAVGLPFTEFAQLPAVAAMPVEIAEEGLKHLAGRHDQSKHGNNTSGKDWKPVMLRGEAEEFVRNSIYKDDVEHVTDARNVASIESKGFDLEHKQSMAVWGDGVYLSTDMQTTSMYREMFGEKTSTLRLKADIRNPLVINIGAEIVHPYKAVIKARNFSTDEFLRWMKRHKSNPADVIIRKFVQEGGYDSIWIKTNYPKDQLSGGNQLVVFDPKKVVVIRE